MSGWGWALLVPLALWAAVSIGVLCWLGVTLPGTAEELAGMERLFETRVRLESVQTGHVAVDATVLELAGQLAATGAWRCCYAADDALLTIELGQLPHGVGLDALADRLERPHEAMKRAWPS